MFASITAPDALHAVGLRVAEAAIGITRLSYFPAPYEEISLKEWALHLPSPLEEGGDDLAAQMLLLDR